MKFIKIDNDSYGTILVSWCICAVLIFLTARYIPILWISLPLCIAFVVFMVFITWFFRVPDRTTPNEENSRLVTSVADGQLQMLTDKCLVGFPYNDAKECERHFFVRIDEASFGALKASAPIRHVVCEKKGYAFAVTEPITVKAMHDLAAELRRHGAKLFFAEKRED